MQILGVQKMSDKETRHICIVCVKCRPVDEDQICWECKNRLMLHQMKIERLKDELRQKATDTYGLITPLKKCFSLWDNKIYFWFNVVDSFGVTTKVLSADL